MIEEEKIEKYRKLTNQNVKDVTHFLQTLFEDQRGATQREAYLVDIIMHLDGCVNALQDDLLDMGKQNVERETLLRREARTSRLIVLEWIYSKIINREDGWASDVESQLEIQIGNIKNLQKLSGE